MLLDAEKFNYAYHRVGGSGFKLAIIGRFPMKIDLLIFNKNEYQYKSDKFHTKFLFNITSEIDLIDHRDKPIIEHTGVFIHTGTETQVAVYPVITYTTVDAIGT